MDNKIKKKIYLSIAGLICIVIVLTASSFALWQVTKKQTNFNAMVTACLDLTINNESSEITMDYAYPITDSEGLATNGYTFTVTNNCDQAVSYAIGIESINDNSGKQFVGNSYIDLSLDGKSPVAFGTLDTVTSDTGASYTIRETKALATRQVAGHKSKRHTIRMWLDENTPLTEQNKTFVSKVTLTGGQGVDAACYSVNNQGLLYDYDAECGKAAVIPASVNNHNITTIASDAFKAEYSEIVYHYRLSNHQEVSSYQELAHGQCGTEGIDKDCTVDMSLAISDKLLPAFIDNSLIPTILPTATTDDFYFIQYTDDLTSAQIAGLKSSLWSVTQLDQMGLPFNYNNLEVYVYGEDELPAEGNGRPEWYAAATYSSGSWIGHYLGSKETDGTVATGKRLAINSLDLSQAVYLNKIEDRAFSNAVDFDSNIMADDSEFDSEALHAAMEPGLTSLTFGSNARNIEFGWASFAKANLDTLTIYDTYHVPRVGSYDRSVIDDFDISDPSTIEGYTLDETDVDSYYAISYGAFGGSTIGTLNINSSLNAYNPSSGYAFIWGRFCINQSCDVVPMAFNSSLFGGQYGLLSNIYTTINTVNFDNNISTIGMYAFAATQIGSLNLPSSLTTIGESAFDYMSGSSKTVTIPSLVTSMGDYAFNKFDGTIYTSSQTLIDTKANWANKATVLPTP